MKPGLILGVGKLGEDRLGPVAILTANLGAITGTGDATRTTFATAEAQCGSLSALADVSVVNYATANATLGALVATGNAEVENVVTASALLGALNATASVDITHFANAQASLGSLVAIANTQPEPISTGGGGGVSYIQPNFWPLPEPEITEPIVETQYGITVNAKLGGLIAQATSDITFSITEDESELLLLI